MGNYVLLSLSRGVKSVMVSVHGMFSILIHVQFIYCCENKRGPHAVKPFRLVNFKLVLFKNFLMDSAYTAKFGLAEYWFITHEMCKHLVNVKVMNN